MFEKQKEGEGLFIPQCKVTKDGNELRCEPVLMRDGKTFKAPRPIIMRMVGVGEGKQLIPIDDGGAPALVIKKLEEYLESKRLD